MKPKLKCWVYVQQSVCTAFTEIDKSMGEESKKCAPFSLCTHTLFFCCFFFFIYIESFIHADCRNWPECMYVHRSLWRLSIRLNVWIVLVCVCTRHAHINQTNKRSSRRFLICWWVNIIFRVSRCRRFCLLLFKLFDSHWLRALSRSLSFSPFTARGFVRSAHLCIPVLKWEFVPFGWLKCDESSVYLQQNRTCIYILLSSTRTVEKFSTSLLPYILNVNSCILNTHVISVNTCFLCL